jgi:hypothetical protein
MLRFRACFLLIASACAHASGAASNAAPARGPVPNSASACLLPTELPAAELMRQHGTVLDAYQITDGAWLDHAPVLINEDFDFALAMGMEGGVGAGLAAAKRKENNARKAAALSGVVASSELQRRLAELRCCGVHVYFLLWGAQSASLRTVVDVPGDTARRRELEGAARPLTGELGWTKDAALVDEAQRALAGIECPAAGVRPPQVSADAGVTNRPLAQTSSTLASQQPRPFRSR